MKKPMKVKMVPAIPMERLGGLMQKSLRMAGKGSLADDPEALNAAFEAGWRTAANWVERDDLIADIGSPAYLADRAAALSQVGQGKKQE